MASFAGAREYPGPLAEANCELWQKMKSQLQKLQQTTKYQPVFVEGRIRGACFSSDLQENSKSSDLWADNVGFISRYKPKFFLFMLACLKFYLLKKSVYSDRLDTETCFLPRQDSVLVFVRMEEK